MTGPHSPISNAVRIGRVRPKVGGDIRVLPVEPRTEPQQGLIESAVELCADFPELAGFVIVTWDDTGTAWCQSWIDEPEHNPISASLAPAFVHDAVYSHLQYDEDEDL